MILTTIPCLPETRDSPLHVCIILLQHQIQEKILIILPSSFRLPQWLSGKESACNAADTGNPGSIPGSGRSPGGGHGNLLQCSCLGNPMDRGTWQATVHRVTKSQTLQKWLSMHTCTTIFQGCTIMSYASSESLPSSLLFWVPLGQVVAV